MNLPFLSTTVNKTFTRSTLTDSVCSSSTGPSPFFFFCAARLADSMRHRPTARTNRMFLISCLLYKAMRPTLNVNLLRHFFALTLGPGTDFLVFSASYALAWQMHTQPAYMRREQ